MVRHEPGWEASYLELAALSSAAFWARCHTKATLRAWCLWPDTIDSAELLVSELITNSIQAAGCELEPKTYSDLAGVERVSLTLRLLPGRIVIEVFDRNPEPPVPGDADADAESGRGLMIVRALSKEWGHFFPPSGGKTVFAVLDVPPSFPGQQEASDAPLS